jgi:hypothetical protein
MLPTIAQVEAIMAQDKYIIVNGVEQHRYVINQAQGLSLRIDIRTVDRQTEMTWHIRQSSKNTLKMSLHVMGNGVALGLNRVDYHGAHQNPQTAPDDLPTDILPYVGHFFPANESHEHRYYPDRHGTLKWAIPISASDCRIKDINDNNQNIAEAILSFAGHIRLKTILTINRLIL